MRVAAPQAMFDACRSGLVLRAVLWVELIVAAAAMFRAATPLQWLEQAAFFTGGSGTFTGASKAQ